MKEVKTVEGPGKKRGGGEPGKILAPAPAVRHTV